MGSYESNMPYSDGHNALMRTGTLCAFNVTGHADIFP